MLTEKELDAKYTDDEYQEHIEEFNANKEETEQRFVDWLKINVADLKRIYCRRVMDDEEMAHELGFPQWCQQMFIAWDYNRKKEQAIAKEMKEMYGEV